MDWDWDDVDPCPREAEVGFAGVCEPEPEIPGALGPAGGLREGAKEGVGTEEAVSEGKRKERYLSVNVLAGAEGPRKSYKTISICESAEDSRKGRG
jgi:hypothetical protein